MKVIFILPIVFIVAALLISCEKKPEPESIYYDYLASIQAMSSMSENNYQRFISARAKSYVINKINKIDEEQLSRFLTFFKAEAVLPKGSKINVENKNQETVILRIIAKDYPEQGTTYEKNITFIQEKGWKIDKIEVITSGEDFKFKSTTY